MSRWSRRLWARGPGRGRGRGRGGRATATAANPALAGHDDEQTVLEDRTGRIWSTTPPAAHRRQVQDIIKQQPGVTADAHKEKPTGKQRDATKSEVTQIRKIRRNGFLLIGSKLMHFLDYCYSLVFIVEVRKHCMSFGHDTVVDQYFWLQ